MRLLPLFALAAIACKPSSPATETDPGTPIPSLHTADTGVTTPTGDTAPEIPVFDCSVLPVPPFDTEQIEGARARHGIAFDTLGNLVGENGTSVILTSAPSATSVLAPNLGSLEQMDYLPSGELVVSRLSNGAITGILPNGQTRIIAPNINAYGVIVGPDGLIYAANQDRVYRIDPATGDSTVFVDLPGSAAPKVVNFSPALDRFYIGTNYSEGRVYEVDLDTNFEPVGDVRVLATSVGNSWHDGLGVDVCGNLYVNEYWSSGLYRVNPSTGDTETLLIYQDSNQYGHGMAWGSGIGPWPADSIFIPQPYNGNTVRRAHLGLPSRTFNGGVYEVVGL